VICQNQCSLHYKHLLQLAVCRFFAARSSHASPLVDVERTALVHIAILLHSDSRCAVFLLGGLASRSSSARQQGFARSLCMGVALSFCTSTSRIHYGRTDAFLLRDAMLGRYMLWPCVCSSVCLSVTNQCSTKMAKRKIMLTVPECHTRD